MSIEPRKQNFVLQQGFALPADGSCSLQYGALQFQPRIVGVLVLVGVLLQSALWFGALSVILFWGAIVPAANLFEAAHRALFAGRGAHTPGPAPGPRRFAQALAGSFMVAIALSLRAGNTFVAWALEGILLAAIAALVFGGFCLGSFVFHALRGRLAFALRTLPWAKR